MKMATTLVLLCGLLFGQHTYATEPKTQRSQWGVMKPALASVLWSGLLVGTDAQPEKATIERPHWVIMATIVDRTTGEQLEQNSLEGRAPEFDDPVKCQAIVDRVRPIATDRVTAVLTRARIGPAEDSL
jgi:hypothetical protein